MFNIIAFLMGIITALYPQPAEKPAAKITNGAATGRIVRTPPRADEQYSRENGYRVLSFDMDDYELNKQNLDEKYARRSYLREKMAKEIADFLADYEEYEILTRNYRRELYETGNRAENDNSAREDGSGTNIGPADNSLGENRRENGNGKRDNSGNRPGNGSSYEQPGKVYIPAPPEVDRPRPVIPGGENDEQPGDGQKIPSPSDPDSTYIIKD